MTTTDQDQAWMQLALAQARAAMDAGEVPVGAVLVKDGALVASGRNAPIAGHDPSAHAEIAALRAGAQALGNYRLDGCTLYVTLEPCAMCAGALLHARVGRVVFGAADPKTGAAGSVVNLFAEPRLNHQTQLHGGVLAEACAAPLAAFFRARRAAQKAEHPLRDDALRTPEVRFAALAPPHPEGHYLSSLPTLSGLRLHYLDVGPQESAVCWLLVDGEDGWSYRWQPLIAALAASGARVIAPDLIGFGRSDKPKKEAWHTPAAHRQVLLELIESLALPPVRLLVAQADWALQPGTPLAQRCVAARRVHLLYDRGFPSSIPFPDAGHRAGPRALARWPADGDSAAALRLDLRNAQAADAGARQLTDCF